MKYIYYYISKFLFIFIFISSKSYSINPLNKRYILNIEGNSDNLYFYYISIFVGSGKQRQTFILDTTSSITTSPCNLCSSCGDHFNDYYLINDHSSIIDINSEECNLLPGVSNNFSTEKDFQLYINNCYFESKLENETISGIYLNNLINFESIIFESNSLNEEIIYKNNEFKLPLGCTLKETGLFKTILTDGIIGLNNNNKSFISLIFLKKIISNNIFSLCLDKKGGYLSLGNIFDKYHLCPQIKYIDYCPNNDEYELKIEKIIIKDIEIEINYSSIIDSSSTISYFPEKVFNNISIALFEICSENEGKCGKLKRIEGYGICSDFNNKNEFNNTFPYIFPQIKIFFKNYIFHWEPKNYLVNLLKNNYGICLGIDTEKNLNKIILGTNFMRGYDIIFDRANYKIGFCEAVCNRNFRKQNKDKKEKDNNKIKINNQNIIRNKRNMTNENGFENIKNNKVNTTINNKDKFIEKIHHEYLILLFFIIFIF